MLRSLAISTIVTNDGQITGLPRNPRSIKQHKFEQLKNSIVEFPEMVTKYRPVIVYPAGKLFVAIAGNMRFLAVRDLGWTELPCLVLDKKTPLAKLKELAIKDNADFGDTDWEILANEWSDLPLEDWGVDLPAMDEFAPNLEPQVSNRKISAEDIVKTRHELETQHAGTKHEYAEVICPHCLETFFLNPD